MDEELSLNSLNVEKLDRRIVVNFLKVGLKGEVGHFIDEYMASLGDRNVQSRFLTHKVTQDIYFYTKSINKKNE